jgi:uncharacterized membrane protein
MKFLSEKNYRILFIASIIVKALTGAGEIVLGFMFYYFNYAQLAKIAFFLTGDELTEPTRGIFWQYVARAAHEFSATGQSVWAFIFLSHGIIKIALAIGLMKKIHWTYPIAAVIFGLFVIYQCYQYTYAPSFLLAAITIFDILVIWLVMHEYKTRSKFGILRS